MTTLHIQDRLSRFTRPQKHTTVSLDTKRKKHRSIPLGRVSDSSPERSPIRPGSPLRPDTPQSDTPLLQGEQGSATTIHIPSEHVEIQVQEFPEPVYPYYTESIIVSILSMCCCCVLPLSLVTLWNASLVQTNQNKQHQRIVQTLLVLCIVLLVCLWISVLVVLGIALRPI
jgi:hypothetical protein